MRHGVPRSSRCSRTGSPAFVGELCGASISFAGAAIFVPVPYLLFVSWLTLQPSPNIRSHFSTQVIVTLEVAVKLSPAMMQAMSELLRRWLTNTAKANMYGKKSPGEFPLSLGTLDRIGPDRLGFRQGDPSRFVGFRGTVGGEHYF
jgi:hypothetical protein